MEKKSALKLSALNKRALIAILASAFLSLLFCSGAFGQTDQSFEEYGVGPRDGAMGNAYTGVADDFSAAFYNPSGTSQTKDLHIALGYKFLTPRLTAKLEGFGADRFTKYPTTHWGMLGFTTDLNVPSIINPKYTSPFSIALAAAISNFLHSYTNYATDRTPYYFRYQDRPIALLSLYTSLGVKVTKWFSFGAGFVVAPSGTYIDARVRTDIYLPKAEFVAKQGLVERAYGVLQPVAGLMFRIPIAGLEDRLRIGATWRNRVIVIDGRGKAVNRIVIHSPTGVTMSPVPPMDVPVITMSGFSPMQVALGFSYQPYNGALISTDTLWKHWSEWRTYFLHTPDPRFHDTWQQRLGFEQKFFQGTPYLEYWALRAGYYYEPSPAGSQNNEWNILDNDKHVMTAGFGLCIGKVLGIIKTPVNFDGGFQAHYLVPKTIKNNNDPAYTKIKTGGMVYSGSVALEFSW